MLNKNKTNPGKFYRRPAFYIISFTLLVGIIVSLLLTDSFLQKQAEELAVSVDLSGPPESDSTILPVFALCPEDTCSCACDDPFDPRILVDTPSVFAGKCLNTCRIRSVLPLTIEQVKEHDYFSVEENDKNKYLFAANVSYRDTSGENDFYVAKIPEHGLVDIIIQIEYAGGLQAHGQMRFKFKEDSPVLLVDQCTESEKIEIPVHDLIFSAEALAPPGIPYKGDWGMRSEYFIAYRFSTLMERAHVQIKKLHRPVWQFRVQSRHNNPIAVLKKALALSAKLGHSDKYHTINNNCIQSVLRVLDAGEPVPWYRKPFLYFTKKSEFLPTRLPKHLKYRGLAASKKGMFRIPNLEKELGWEMFVDSKLLEEN